MRCAIRLVSENGDTGHGLYVTTLTIPHSPNQDGTYVVLVKVVGYFGEQDERYRIGQVLTVNKKRLISL